MDQRLHFARQFRLVERLEHRGSARGDGSGDAVSGRKSARDREPDEQGQERHDGEERHDRAQRHVGGELAPGADRLRDLHDLIARDRAEHAPVAVVRADRGEAQLRVPRQVALRLRQVHLDTAPVRDLHDDGAVAGRVARARRAARR